MAHERLAWPFMHLRVVRADAGRCSVICSAGRYGYEEHVPNASRGPRRWPPARTRCP
jgi:hypothetical protein